MIRDIVIIDEDKCDGCGLCVPACAEGAIQIIDGKAKLAADNLCDGLGACLGHCPQDAIKVIQRAADEFDEEAVDQHLKSIGREPIAHTAPAASHAGGGCPSAQVKSFATPAPTAGGGCPSARVMDLDAKSQSQKDEAGQRPSELQQWPIQLHLVPPTAPFLQGSDLLLAADCAPFAYADFHKDILKDKKLLIACPKLDDGSNYVDKMTAMIQQSDIKSLTVVHMEVPCCTGLIHMAKAAISQSGKDIPLEAITVGIQGDIK